MSDPIDLGKLTFVMAEKHGEQAMSDPIDLDELRALLEKATPGTLRAEAGETAKLRDDFGLVAIMSHLTRYPLPVAGAATPSRRRDSDKVAALAHLVAAAVNALPTLLDELESARAKLEAVEGIRPATAEDIRPGAVIYYPNTGDYGPFIVTVEEPLHYGDAYKAFCATDGCRYGLEDAHIIAALKGGSDK